MTLIAAWITEKFRIVASDSKITGTNGVQPKGSPQKVFASNEMALGIFGALGSRIVEFKREKLILGKLELENWNLNKFKFELSNYLNNDKISGDNKELESNILVVPLNETPSVLRIKDHKIQKEFNLEDYKAIYQIKELGDLFFSEQELSNKNIDTEHQQNLLKHLKGLEKLNVEEFEIEIDEPFEVKVLIKLVLDSMDENKNDLNRNNIGGNKVYYAYSYGGNTWKQNFYLRNHKMKSTEDMMNEFNQFWDEKFGDND